MGNRFEVHAFVKTEDGYEYQQVWAKRSGAGCVKVEWR